MVTNVYVSTKSTVGKESYPRVNEGKQQSKQFIIYNLDSIARVNDNFLDYKIAKEKNMHRRGSRPICSLIPDL